ncbi:uncharacterized protein PHALS_10686 [Plasmopara halstedii]|uniref:Uncharacterized protein n=1 Tax=Plasmopara halstedii TaxID=4781 RepID=A0A0P1AJ00_PLAHL|nr:uncharacterized protein PHALS_10686 [Plasmopara halstedii]CEG40490.1 hypothetical protein PHALS_10686 [Plasmopara halstedii]|eukprot:XP_024576859.1 hypothetical protein PHALS_10686 [Plasmopara halstedii]
MKFTQTEILSSYSPVVEAKKNNFDQGKAQVLIGCEAIADREGLFTVYSIVTDFMKWDKAVAACYRLYYATIAFWFQDVFKITEKCLLPLIGDGLRDSQYTRMAYSPELYLSTKERIKAAQKRTQE